MKNKSMCYLFIFIFLLSGCSVVNRKTETVFSSDFGLPKINIPVAYRAIDKEVVTLEPLLQIEKIPMLPNKLVIEPGLYNFAGNIYNLSEPGCYRFYFYGNGIASPPSMQQRIIFNGNIEAFLSALSWITAHGYFDNTLKQNELEDKALIRKIILTCGPVAYFAHNFLQKFGIKSRAISVMTLEDWNTYDNGHALLEVYFKDIDRWILYDIDAKAYFSLNGKSLNALEAYHAVKDGNFDLIPIANTTKLDIRDDLFLLEHLNNTSKIWYKRIMQILNISSYYFCEDTLENRERIKKIDKTSIFINEEEFRQKFYDSNPR